MPGCEALATKAELNALKQELLAKIEPKASKSDIFGIVQSILAGAGFATVGQVQMLGNQVDFLRNKIPSVEQLASGAYSRSNYAVSRAGDALARVNETAAKTSQALQTAQAAQAAIPPLAQIAMAALSIGLLIKQLIDQKANKIEMSVIAKEAAIAQSVANSAYVQAYNARSEARIANQKVTKAIGDAEYAKGRAEQANSLANAASNQASAAQAIAQMAVSQANAAIAKVEQLASELEAEVKAIEQKVKAEINVLEQQVSTERAAIEKQVASEIAQLNNKIQKEIAAILNELTMFKINTLEQLYSISKQLPQKANEYEVRTVLKGITYEVKEIPTLKSNAKQLESSLTAQITKTNTEINTLKNTQFKPQIKKQIQTEIQPYQQKVQKIEEKQLKIEQKQIKTEEKQLKTEEQIKMDKEQFKQIDTKLTNILATAGITAATVQLLPQVFDKINNFRSSPCLAPVYVPPVDSKVSTNISLTNTLQGVVVAQNAVLQGTANAINTTVRATNGIVRAMQPVLNTVSTGLNALTTFTETAWRATKMDKVLNLLNTALLFHNALMLSNNIGYTLIEIIENTLTAIGIKDENGDEIDVRGFIGTSISNFIKGIIGESLYTNLSTTFKKANRIYQSAANIFWLARSMMDSVREISEIAAENIGVIGNALKRDGVVDADSYPRMPEKVDGTSRFLRRLENISDAVDTVEEVSDEVRSISEDFTDMREQQQEFKEALDDWTKAENEKVDDASRAINASPQPQPTDEVEADG